MPNNSGKNIILNSLLASAGLALFGFGVYLTIQANIGVAPWDAFNLGLTHTFGIKYGNANIIVSMIIVVIDILLREKIGIGMLLDALLVGKFVDLYNYINILPEQQSLVTSLPVMFIGMVIMGFSQFLYMKAGLGCGPRDSLLVGLKRRAEKIPIGLISVAIMAVVTLTGWLLGGPIGIGTLICAFLEGPIMQYDFQVVRFNPTEVRHQSLMESFRILSAPKQQ